MRMLRWAFILTVILLLAVGAGLSIALYFIQQRQSQVITDESAAVRRLEVTDRAALILSGQREAVAAAGYEPFNHQKFAQQTTTFQAIMKMPLLANTQQGDQLLHDIFDGQQQFSTSALRLSAHPSPVNVQAVRAQGEKVFILLNTFRTQHAISLAALYTSEREQRRLNLLMIIVTNGVVIILAFVGFTLLTRLGHRQSEADALHATDKLRREFIAFTAHELRNPASAIQTGVSLLREPEIDAGLRQQVVESITRSADALNRLIYNLLAMGRSEEGRLPLHRTDIAIAAFFADVLEELAVYHPGIEQRVHRDLPDMQIHADPEYLRLVIANILDNAVKYSPPRSAITVTGEVKEKMLIVHLYNQGPGIPPEELSRLFELYETTGTAPYSLRRGVGLGLYMARLLIQAQGGEIWAESQPGDGATVSFTLPASQASLSENDDTSGVPI